MQLPDFGTGEDARAMWNRLQRFDCVGLPSVDRTMEEKYRVGAMEIIHWMTVFLKDMDLFGNSLNGNSDYKPTRATSEKEIFDITTDTDSAVDLSVLDSSILPIGMVEVRANI